MLASTAAVSCAGRLMDMELDEDSLTQTGVSPCVAVPEPSCSKRKRSNEDQAAETDRSKSVKSTNVRLIDDYFPRRTMVSEYFGLVSLFGPSGITAGNHNQLSDCASCHAKDAEKVACNFCGLELCDRCQSVCAVCRSPFCYRCSTTRFNLQGEVSMCLDCLN